MTIKKKIYVIVIVVVMQTVMVCAVLFWAKERVQRSLAMTGAANEIMEGVSDLNLLAGEFLLVRNDRPLKQWKWRVESLKEDIRESELLLSEEASLIDDINANLALVEETEKRLMEYSVAEGAEFERGEKLVERTVLMFMIASQNLSSVADNLVQRTNVRINRLVYRTTAFSLVFLLLSGAGIIMTVLAVARSIDRPVNKLLKAAQEVGSGRLDKETGIDSKDEIGLFARAFDSMIERLREITVSRDDLVAEVAERRRAEEELVRSETRYRTIFENGLDGISIYEVRFDSYRRKLVDCNEAYASAAGMTREEMLAVDDVSRLQANEYGAEERETFREKIKNGEPYSGMFSWKRPDGLENHIEFKSVPVNMDGVTLVFGIDRDVTARVKAEQSLRESEELFRQLAQNVKECFYLKDVRENRMIYVNPVFEDVWSASAEEAARDARVMFDEVHADDVDYVGALLAKEQKGVEVQGEFRITPGGAGRRWIWYRSFPVTNDEGRVYRVAGIAEDVTWRKNIEEKLRNLSLKVITAQESERKRIGRELHDGTGQTLSAIKILLERETARLKSEHPEIDIGQLKKIVPFISDVIVEVRRILMDLRPSMLDDLGLVAAMNWFCREFQIQYPLIKVHSDIEVDEQAVDDTEKTVLFRVMQEAMHNVAKHSGADRVSVELRHENGRLDMTVRDNGRGFDVSEENFRGVGLIGMRERMELISGDFSLESSPGEGAAVTASIRVNGS